MDRRPANEKWTERYSPVVLNWINSLDEVSCPFTRLSYASKSDVIPTLIKKIYETEKKTLPQFQNHDELVYKFTKEYFPEHHAEKHLSLLNEEDSLVIYSLLMYTCCIRCQIQGILERNCKFIDGTTQGILEKFFQEMLRIGDGNFTRANISSAIFTSLGLEVSNRRQSQSPVVLSNCLKEFFYSPTLQDRQNKMKETTRLKCLWEEEINEKNEVLERNSKLEEELKKSHLLISEKLKEINSLKEDLERLSQPMQVNEHKDCKEKILTQENEELLKENKEIKLEIEDLYVQLEKSAKEIFESSVKIKVLEESLEFHQKQYEVCNAERIAVLEENFNLKCSLEEQKKTIESLEEQLRPVEIQDVSMPLDLSSLGKVVELELQEQIEELLQAQDSYKKELEIKSSQLSRSLTIISELEGKILSLETEQEKNVKSQESLQGEIQKLQNDLALQVLETDSLSEAKSKLETANATQSSQLSRSLTIISELEGKILSLETEQEENVKSQELLQGEIQKLQNTLALQVLETDSLSEAKSKLETANATQEKVHQQVLNENEELKSRCAYLNNVASDLRTKLSVAEESLEETKEVIEKQKINIIELDCSLRSTKEQADQMQQQFDAYDPQLKEAHDKLYQDFHILTDEHESLSAKYNSLLEDHKNVRSEYDAKLEKLKRRMTDSCTQALQKCEEQCEKKVKELQHAIRANQEHINQLSSQLWDTSDKLITTKKDNEELKKSLNEWKSSLSHQNMDTLNRRTRSVENVSFTSPTPPSKLQGEEPVLPSRRQSVRTVPSGMGKVFPSEDEGEEMFNNECLADLKAGRCQVPNDPNRLSTLMYRNSLCPPHLKSSYPAETQFMPADAFHEDDIKGRAGDAEAASEKQRRKSRSQMLELKSEATPRNVLRELNDGTRKPGTPSKLFSHFFTSRPRDENETPSTPNQRRLSFFNRHFGKRDAN